MDKKVLGKRINAARKDCGLTGEKLAEACNINATYLRQIESGIKIPSMPMFATLCRKLKVSPSYLLPDIVPENGEENTDELFSLWKKASPKQLKVMTAMIRAAMDAIED